MLQGGKNENVSERHSNCCAVVVGIANMVTGQCNCSSNAPRAKLQRLAWHVSAGYQRWRCMFLERNAGNGSWMKREFGPGGGVKVDLPGRRVDNSHRWNDSKGESR